ncbi:MAG: type II toxin-antitoxin system HicB family antitoxin [Chloroflexi bacterium]|nr:type II toxin-antitoxin system HicB family antitoxin [Chloroflexota bacterium]
MVVFTRALTVVLHEAEEGGYWAEVIGLPGCVSQGETREETIRNIHDAIEAVDQYEPSEAEILALNESPDYRVTYEENRLGSGFPEGGTGTFTASVSSS